MPKMISPNYFDAWKSMLDIDIKTQFSEVEKIILEPHSSIPFLLMLPNSMTDV
jgi:hypothetical protein